MAVIGSPVRYRVEAMRLEIDQHSELESDTVPKSALLALIEKHMVGNIRDDLTDTVKPSVPVAPLTMHASSTVNVLRFSGNLWTDVGERLRTQLRSSWSSQRMSFKPGNA